MALSLANSVRARHGDATVHARRVVMPSSAGIVPWARPGAAPRRTARTTVTITGFKGPADATTQGAKQDAAALASTDDAAAHMLLGNNVYGKPFTKSERAALKLCLEYLNTDTGAAAAVAAGPAATRDMLMAVMLEAATRKALPLARVEGGMVLLELMAINGVAAAGPAMSPDDMLGRWQLVVGADVGAVQYIPAVEELQVSPDGRAFTLDTDLDVLLTGFSGHSEWLAPGHLSYTVRSVRIELRTPKAYRRAAAWLQWRRAGGGAGGPDYGDALATSQTCHPQPGRWPATDVPLPFFPNNELKAFLCDGKVAATRSKLGGLILLINIATREQMRPQPPAAA